MTKTSVFSSAATVAVSALLAFSLAACANPVDLITEGIAEKVIGEMTDGSVTDLLSTEIPADFPDIPRPSGDPERVFAITMESGPAWTLEYVFSDDSEQARLGQALIAAGFSEVSSVTIGEISSALYTNDEFTVAVSLASNDGGFDLQYVVTTD